MSIPLSPDQRAEAHAEFAAWLVKKAREYRSAGSGQHALQADAIASLASKVTRGAVRADNLRTLPAQGGAEDEAAGLLAEVERLREQRDRYRSAWLSARERAQIDGREVAYWMPLDRRRDEEASRLRNASVTPYGDEPEQAEFLQPGRTYASGGPYTAPELRFFFRAEHVTRHPDRGHLRAIGWMRSGASGEGWHGSFLDEGQVEGWVEQPAEDGEHEAGAPTLLRWGLDDAEVGDDDSVTLWLSGPAGEPYALELAPDRAAALRALLAERAGGDCCCGPEFDHDNLTMPAAQVHQVGCPANEREAGCG